MPSENISPSWDVHVHVLRIPVYTLDMGRVSYLQFELFSNICIPVNILSGMGRVDYLQYLYKPCELLLWQKHP
jgi:hypothetical protein